jgi:hypothetical protein
MTRSRRRYLFPAVVALGLVVSVGLTAIPDSRPALAAESPVGLGNAGSFAVLGGQLVSNTGPTVIAGDLGVSPKPAVTGFPPGTVNGTTHPADAVSALAQLDLTTAYLDAANRTDTTSKRYGALDGLTLGPGVYSSPLDLTLGGTLVLNGDATSVFIFKAARALDVGSSSVVSFTGGASACNVFWQVTSSATLNTGANFAGTIMALTSVMAQTGAKVTGRLLARNGEVTLDTNTITRPTVCATAPPATPATPVPGRAHYPG